MYSFFKKTLIFLMSLMNTFLPHMVLINRAFFLYAKVIWAHFSGFSFRTAVYFMIKYYRAKEISEVIINKWKCFIVMLNNR